MNQFIISSLLVFFIKVTSSDELSSNECLNLGFRKSELNCDRCNELNKFGLDSLKESCFSCCQGKSSSEPIKKYSKAALEICGCNIRHFPQVQAFVNSDKPKQFSNFQVKYVRGTLPRIKLMNSDGDVIEELNVEKWDTDTIEEFLREQLL